MPWKKIAGLVLAAALYALFCTAISSRTVEHDAVEYFRYGVNFAATGVYGYATPGVADMDREPGYGVFLGICLKLFGFLAGEGDAGKIGLLVFLQSLLYFSAAALFACLAPLPGRVRALFFAFQVASSALLGANVELYSETLAISMLTVFLLAVLKNVARPAWAWIAAGGLAYAAALLTKAYLYFFSPFFFAAALAFFLRRQRTAAVALAVATLAGIAAQKTWDARNRALFGDDLESGRVAAAMAGHILRAEDMDPARDWRVGLSASIGSNFCERAYGRDRCDIYTMARQDLIGFNRWAEQRRKYGKNQREAFAALRREMASRWFEHPGRQLYSSALEVVRIAMFEAPPGRFAAYVPVLVLQLWHVLGSLLFWGLAVAGGAVSLRSRNPVVRIGIAFSATFVFAHFFFMGQVENLGRYAFPMTPFVYFAAAIGAAGALQRRFLN